jgi:hypothetical protein
MTEVYGSEDVYIYNSSENLKERVKERLKAKTDSKMGIAISDYQKIISKAMEKNSPFWESLNVELGRTKL